MCLFITPNNLLPIIFSIPVAPGFSILMIFLPSRRMLSSGVRMKAQFTGKLRFPSGFLVFMSLVQIDKKKKKEEGKCFHSCLGQ